MTLLSSRLAVVELTTELREKFALDLLRNWRMIARCRADQDSADAK
jgi:hypothetical protein